MPDSGGRKPETVKFLLSSADSVGERLWHESMRPITSFAAAVQRA
jgi:hypothetical protein